MTIEDWDEKEIKRLALESGEPLEVRCAEAFMNAKWRVRLGTYYRDISDKLRELDFLAQKTSECRALVAPSESDVQLTLRILGSCKGFPANCGPATYFVFASSHSIEKPLPMCHAYGFRSGEIKKEIKQRDLLDFITDDLPPYQIVGFDVFEYQEKEKNRPSTYVSKTDKSLFEGLSSAVFSAIHWFQDDKLRHGYSVHQWNGHIYVNIPLLVLASSFWNVSIDGGEASAPILLHGGIHASTFPLEKDQPAECLTSIIWDARIPRRFNSAP